MHKLSYFVVLRTNTIFRIAPHFLRNIKYHQEIWNNLSVEILWKFLTAGHLVHSRPCRAAGHLDTARKILVFRYTISYPPYSTIHVIPYFLIGIICGPIWGSFPVRDHLRSNLGIICGPGSFAVLESFADPYRSTDRLQRQFQVQCLAPELKRFILDTQYL